MDVFVDRKAFHIRLTFTAAMDLVETFAKGITDEYIVCSEVTHFHCYVATRMTREELIIMINEKLDLHGNKQFSCTDVRSKRQMKKYVLKDGFYVSSGFSEKELRILKKLSVKKFGEEFETRRGLLEDDYLSKPKQRHYWLQFATDYVLLRSEYGNVRKCDIEGYLNRMRVLHEGRCGASDMVHQWFPEPYR